MRRRARREVQGFSLVEALVGMVIFTALMAAVSQYLLSVPRVNVRTNDTQRVTLAAKTYFEQTRAVLAANFGAALPSAPTLDGGSCTSASAEQLRRTLPTGGSQVAVRRVTLSCTVRGNVYSLAQDFGARP